MNLVQRTGLRLGVLLAAAALGATGPASAQEKLAPGSTQRVQGTIHADAGRGIDPALQSRLFEPFFTTRHDGTGLGLAIARGVARAHGGDIRIDSEPGRGTTFTLTLAMGA